MAHQVPATHRLLRPGTEHLPFALLLAPSCACSAPQEAARADVPVVVDSSGLETVTTNLGYDVSVSQVDVAIRDLEFAVAGEIHTSLWQEVSDMLVPAAWAHPGHFQGGDIAGELSGSFVLHFAPEKVEELGTATLLVGDYRSVNFFFRRDEGARLRGHTAIIRGYAQKSDEDVGFSVILDSPEDRQLVGAPFEQRVAEGAKLVIGLRLLVQDPTGDGTLFDDVDFFALDQGSDGDVDIEPYSDNERTIHAYNQIHRRFQTHNHFDARAHD